MISSLTLCQNVDLAYVPFTFCELTENDSHWLKFRYILCYVTHIASPEMTETDNFNMDNLIVIYISLIYRWDSLNRLWILE